MKKSDSPPAGPAPGRLIDQPIARRATARECGIEISDAVADVMNARATFREELRHGAGRFGRLEQLDIDIAKVEADDSGAVRVLRGSGSQAEDIAVERQGITNAGYGDTNVGDRSVHTGKLTT